MPLNSSLKQRITRFLPLPILDMIREIKHRRHRLPDYRAYQRLLVGKSGIEIGGPSVVFRHILPIYSVIAGLDGVNFSGTTMWEGAIAAGRSFVYAAREKAGQQFIAEATDLSFVPTGNYQFLLSSNCLEHVANPIKALKEWVRVVEPGGLMLLILPDKRSNFDHRRPVTRFDHVLDDYRSGVGEDDLTHLNEILELHDLERDPWASGRDNFIRRSRDNFKHRGLHHHVFDSALITQMTTYVGITPLRQGITPTDFVFLGQTPVA
jgi:SAM-dependent methyltransferase